jgi:hypothetical protein
MISSRILKVYVCVSCLLFFSVSGFDSVTDQDSARRQFDKFAWQLFILVNRPTKLPQGDPGVFWESWATPDYVFGRPDHAPTWVDRNPPILDVKPLFKTDLASNVPIPSKLPDLCDRGHGQDVRLNEATVKFIADNKLYNIEGQIALSKKGGVEFPPDSIEIKAYWDNIAESEKDQFYSRQCGSNYFGLTALHIITKSISNWTWATFEHISTGGGDKYNPNQCWFLPCRDSFGALPEATAIFQPTPELADLFNQAGMRDEWRATWRHYRLVGTQTDFVTPEGKPTRLGNSVMEGQFGATSSCITCHARASIEVDEKGVARLQPQASKNGSFNGVPSPCWYLGKDGSLKFGKLDFVWSLRKAQSETGKLPPPKFVLNDCS